MAFLTCVNILIFVSYCKFSVTSLKVFASDIRVDILFVVSVCKRPISVCYAFHRRTIQIMSMMARWVSVWSMLQICWIRFKNCLNWMVLFPILYFIVPDKVKDFIYLLSSNSFFLVPFHGVLSMNYETTLLEFRLV